MQVGVYDYFKKLTYLSEHLFAYISVLVLTVNDIKPPHSLFLDVFWSVAIAAILAP